MLTRKQIHFCAMECEMQRTSPYKVAQMCDAYSKALDRGTTAPLSIDFVLELGITIEPDKNLYGCRITPVYFGDPTRQALSPELVPSALRTFINHGQNLTAEEGYIEFERIHPFTDGNGRVGAILYNIFRNTLEDPIFPPKFPNTWTPSDTELYGGYQGEKE